MKNRAVIVEEGLKVTRYEKPVEVSRAYGMLLQTVLNRLSSHAVDKNGLFMYYESEGRPTPAIFGRHRSLVAQSPDGVKVHFNTIREAGRFFGRGTGSIYYALEHSRNCCRWQLLTEVTDDDCVEYKPGMTCHMFVSDHLSACELKQAGIQLSAEDIRKRIGPKRSAGGQRKDGRYRPHEARRDVSYGYFDYELGPVVCPGCGMCVSAAGSRGAEHLKKCLAGHAWRLRFDGVIEVKIDSDSNKLVNDAIFSGRARGKEVSMD